MMRVLRQKKGSSLIEVLIAIAILGLVVAPFLTMFIQAARANVESRAMMDASYYGQNLMEEVKYSIGENGMTDVRDHLTAQGYAEVVHTQDAHYTYTKASGGFTYEVDLDTTGIDYPFFKITVKVYTDAAKTECKADLQALCQ
jgi:prepilin-type N-terminal cleavage/methylation domain-containing protein